MGEDGYVVAHIGGVRVRLHNLILGACPPGRVPDHIDRDPLNNMKSNLRWVHYSEQNYNQGKRPSNTGHRGITKEQSGVYTALIYKNKKCHKKRFKRLSEAKKWRRQMAIELYGYDVADFDGRGMNQCQQ